MMETTLSFAKNPLIRDVMILQSPSPIGLIIGTNKPASSIEDLDLDSILAEFK